MTYRNDHEAAIARIDALEAENAQLRADNERVTREAADRKRRAAQRVSFETTARVEPLPPPAPKAAEPYRGPQPLFSTSANTMTSLIFIAIFFVAFVSDCHF